MYTKFYDAIWRHKATLDWAINNKLEDGFSFDS